MAPESKKPRVSRTVDLFVRLTEDEKRLLAEAAEIEGQSLSDFVRLACRNAARKIIAREGK